MIAVDSLYLIASDVISPFYTYGTPLTLIPFWIAAVSGAVILITQGGRTKDIALRGYFKWIGLFFLTLFISYFPSVFVSDISGLLLLTALNILGGYFLYRSVRSLVAVTENEKFRALPSQSAI